METTTTDRFVPFRGALRAGLGQGQHVVFVTVHPEGQATAVYRLDVDQGQLTSDALPGGGTAIVEADGFVFVAGTDGRIHRGKASGGALAPLGEALDPAPTALAVLSNDRLAAVSGSAVVVLNRGTGKLLQKLALPEVGTALAADASGTWLVAGTTRGTVVVFDGEEKSELIGAESKKLHEGAVTALLFDPDELRVYSTGSDNRLLLTHVRGELEPEDRAGGAAHDNAPQAIALGPEDKLYTAGRDATIKTWARGPQKRRPSTLKEGVGNAVALVRVEHKGRAHLAVLAEDATIRLFPLDAGGKVNERSLTFHDAYALCEHAFTERTAAPREAALRTVAGYNDARAIEILAKRAGEDPEHSVRALATSLLGGSGNPRAVKPLEGLLNAAEEQVRLAALAGLRALEGQASLRPLNLALGAKKRDVGVAAVVALGELAKGDDQAMARLVQALDDDPIEVRAAALASLEALYPGQSATAEIVALRSKRADIRRLALVRCFQRKLLGEAEVLAALRRHEGDPDADVRRAAFLVSLMTRPALSDALRARDRDLGQKLDELATFGTAPAKTEAATEEPKAEAKPEAKAAKGKKPKGEAAPGEVSLAEADLRPLLEAMASRALDTCLAGARGLASLQDERAFGTLLQLTNEKTPAARVEACKALADLGDVRGTKRLRQLLRDGAGEVRDAAFSSLARLEEKTPLTAAEAGLIAPAEDVRGRGLQLLVRQMKKEPPKSLEEASVRLLERALNDTAAAVRGEAFKAALGLGIGGGGGDTLRFALRSIHAEVRREVLGEVMGRIAEPWAPALLLELFADPDAAVRAEAFEFSQKRTKGKSAEPLAAALAGRHADLKLKAVEVLSKRRVDGAGELLQKALGDESAAVRIAAVDALVPEEAAPAMESAHADVRLRAATARAAFGDPRALSPLLSLATEKEPEQAGEARNTWIDRTARALAGLGELGSPDALGAAAALLANKDKRVSLAAAEALGWVARPGGDLAALRAALSHADADVKREAALSLGSVRDASGLPLLKGLTGTSGNVALSGLAAALALGSDADDLFMAYLDHNDEKIRGRALLLMMLVESSEQDGVPDRCLAALSSAHPRVRLVAARALEAFADPAAFAAFVLELFNDRGDERAPWTVPAETVRALAEIFAHGDGQLQVRAARLLDALADEKQDRFDRLWPVFRQRFAPAVDALVAAAQKRKPAASQYAPEELGRVVVGAYAGLSRQVGGALELRVRQTATARLTAMAQADASLKEGAIPVLLLGLGDPAQPVRKLAFDSLVALKMPAADLGAEALAVGQRDMGTAGLELLAQGGEASSRQKVLEQVLLDNTDGLEEEAAKLLAEIGGWPAVHAQALGARSQAARDRAVYGLSQLYDTSDAVKTALRGALGSRYRHVRDRAALELGTKKDPAAFEALTAMLQTEQQQQALDALVRLGDARAPAAFLDRIDKDPAGNALVDRLFAAAGSFRLVTIADRLFGYLDDRKRRSAAASALRVVSGYDQPILDPEDQGLAPGADRTQHPRRDDLLARLLDAAYRLGDQNLVAQLIPAARWARGAELHAALAPLGASTQEAVQKAAIEAIGFRLRKRGGPAEPLIAALSAASPAVQLLAAEGLALGGRSEGVRVLLTAIDTMPDLPDRQRAVRALGQLADPRALDPLLRLVTEEGHALQEDAAEAIGHLKSTPRGETIEATLLRLGKSGPSGVARRALFGLRWFDSREGWSLIRSRAGDEDSSIRLTVAELLAHDEDPATRDALVKQIEEDSDWRVAGRAAKSLRQLDGPDSLEPDYVIVKSRFTNVEPHTVERLRDRGDAARLLELLPKIHPQSLAEYERPLTLALLTREPLPLDAAAAALASPFERVARVAAQILGRAGKAAAKVHGKALVEALKRSAEAWAKARADVDRGKGDLGPPTARYLAMIHAAGKLGTGAEEIVAASRLGGGDTFGRPIRIEALSALATGFAGDAGLTALAAAIAGNDGRERELGAAALGKLAPAKATALAEKVIDDRDSLARLLHGHERDALPALRAAALKVHTQGVALPLLAQGGDVEGLSAALGDKKLPEATRLGALEALATIATEAAFVPILAVAKAEGEEEELRKAAWRALRRGRRYQKKTQQNKAGREVSR